MHPTARVEQALEIPTAVLSVSLLIAVLVPLAYEELSEPWVTTLWAVERLIYVLFVTRFLFLFGIAEDRSDYVRGHPIDLLLVAVPLLRSFRWLEILRTTRVLDAFYILFAACRAIQSSKYRLAISIPLYAIITFPVLVLTSAMVALRAERAVIGTAITEPGKACWWAFMVAASGDTGELHATTTISRCVQVALMVLGAAFYSCFIIGFITACTTRLLTGKSDNKITRATRRAAGVARKSRMGHADRQRTGRNHREEDPPIDDNC